MADRPLLPIVLVRVLVTLSVEAALLAWGLGGLAALAANPRALALLAIWGVAGLTLGVTRPARGQNVARSERDPLALVALALLPLAIPGVAAWGWRMGRWPLPAPNGLGWLGVALSALGLSSRFRERRRGTARRRLVRTW